VRYGANALPYLSQHKVQVASIVIVFVAVSYAVSRVILKERAAPAQNSSNRQLQRCLLDCYIR